MTSLTSSAMPIPTNTVLNRRGAPTIRLVHQATLREKRHPGAPFVSEVLHRRTNYLVLYPPYVSSLTHDPLTAYQIIGHGFTFVYVCANTPVSTHLPFSRSVFTASLHQSTFGLLIPCDAIPCVTIIII